jgi:hypothetical protein
MANRSRAASWWEASEVSCVEFLLDLRRLIVALSRAERNMMLVASRSVFSLFSPDDDVFANAPRWKNLLLRTCKENLWEGEPQERWAEGWGGKGQNRV